MFLTEGDTEKVAVLVGKACPDLDVRSVTILSGGCDNRAFRIGSHHVARFPRDQDAYEALRREEVFCHFVKGRVSLQTPDLKIFCADEHPFSLHAFIKGQSLTSELYACLAEEKKDRVAENLAEFFACLHRTSFQKAWDLGAKPLENYMSAQEMHTVLEYKALSGIRGFGRYVIEEYIRIQVAEQDLVFGHFDVHSENVAFDSAAGELSGIFDFADCGVGDVHREFHPVNLMSTDLCYRTVERYQEKTGRIIDQNRIRLYRVINDLSDLVEYGLGHESHRLIENIVRWRDELFPEWSKLPNPDFSPSR